MKPVVQVSVAPANNGKLRPFALLRVNVVQVIVPAAEPAVIEPPLYDTVLLVVNAKVERANTFVKSGLKLVNVHVVQ